MEVQTVLDEDGIAFDLPKLQHSCRTCRLRKVRCIRPPTSGPSTMVGGDPSPLPKCIACEKAKIECLTEIKRKRRPPRSTRSIDRHKSPSIDVPLDPYTHSYPSTTYHPHLPPTQVGQTASTYYASISPTAPTAHPHPIAPPGPAQEASTDSGEYLGTSTFVTPIAQQDVGVVERIESLMERDTALHILNIQFDHIHPIISLLHRPTFGARFKAKDDHRDQLFLGLCFSVLAVTLVQVPGGSLHMDRETILQIAKTCYRSSRAAVMDCYEQTLAIDLIVLRYYDCIYGFLIGRPVMQAAAHGECTRLCLQMGLHREYSYANLDPVEVEIRRRTFAQVFGSEVATAVLRNMPAIATLSRIHWDAALPREIDDEYITRFGYLDPPVNHVSHVTGFNAAIKLFFTMARTLRIRNRHDEDRSNAQVRYLEDLQKLLDLNARMKSDLQNLPQEFQLQDQTNPQGTSPLLEFDGLSDLGAYLSRHIPSSVNLLPASSPFTSATSPRESHLVVQANIWVTWAVARLLYKVTAEELVEQAGLVDSMKRNAAQGVLDYALIKLDERDQIVSDLLYALQCIPTRVLATNGRSLLDKIRYVAVTLLDTTQEMGRGTSDHDSHERLSKFLNILSEIEEKYVVQSSFP